MPAERLRLPRVFRCQRMRVGALQEWRLVLHKSRNERLCVHVCPWVQRAQLPDRLVDPFLAAPFAPPADRRVLMFSSSRRSRGRVGAVCERGPVFHESRGERLRVHVCPWVQGSQLPDQNPLAALLSPPAVSSPSFVPTPPPPLVPT